MVKAGRIQVIGFDVGKQNPDGKYEGHNYISDVVNLDAEKMFELEIIAWATSFDETIRLRRGQPLFPLPLMSTRQRDLTYRNQIDRRRCKGA